MWVVKVFMQRVLRPADITVVELAHQAENSKVVVAERTGLHHKTLVAILVDLVVVQQVFLDNLGLGDLEIE
jgi:hypothetical protein